MQQPDESQLGKIQLFYEYQMTTERNTTAIMSISKDDTTNLFTKISYKIQLQQQLRLNWRQLVK